ncbi:MAG: hypothetical protein HUJ82_05420 [Megasphaera sp.]|nr:hypothetical protein [Megasphaera sp.]
MLRPGPCILCGPQDRGGLPSAACELRSSHDPEKKGAVARDSPFFKFEVESLMFDVDGFKFKAIASNIIHQTSNIKEKGTSHDGRNLHATVPFYYKL